MTSEMSRVPASWDENIMIAAGAKIIQEVREGEPDERGVAPLVGYDVSPPITPEVYHRAVKSYEPVRDIAPPSLGQVKSALKLAGLTDDAATKLLAFASTLKAPS